MADIASYQQGLIPSELVPDCVALEIKCTQGINYVNPYYSRWLSDTKKTPLIPLAYHWIDGTPPTQQAAYLKSNMVDVSLSVMLDSEKAGSFQQVLSTVDALVSLGCKPKIIYLPHSAWVAMGSPDLSPLNDRHLGLVNAEYPTSQSGSPQQLYPGDNAPGWQAYGGVTPLFYQFTSTALEGGQKIDINAYKGTVDDLRGFLNIAAPPQSSGGLVPPAFPGRLLEYTSGKSFVSGADVRTWQSRMRDRGWRITVDGVYGPASKAVCVAFQTEFHTSPSPGLTVDGVVGAHTWAAAWTVPVVK